ncbi:MAG: TerC family protein [Rhizobiaceae bacterium]
MEFLFSEIAETPFWHWAGFITLILALMAFDLGFLYRKSHTIEMAESLKLSAFYISMACLFGLFIWTQRGVEDAFLFMTGYVVEQSLSMDNVFVIAIILSYFAVPRDLQHRVLFFGILGVILLRGVMILAGSAIIAEFHWILYVFAAFLVMTGIKMMMNGDDEYDVANNWVLKFMCRHFRVTEGFRGDHFVVRERSPQTGRLHWYITPLLLSLCVVEVADVVFAVDSIPAIFAITTDPFIVFTSNIFAILGLRALFFALSALLHRFAYLKFALAIVLIFIGSKILLKDFADFHIEPGWSLAVTLLLLGSGIFISIWKTSGEAPPDPGPVAAVPTSLPHGGQSGYHDPNDGQGFNDQQ